MDHSAALRRCLIEVDVAGARALWRHVAPNMPQPESHAAALATIHHARTQMPNIPIRLRAYSHQWLVGQGLPSGLPDRLRPRAERMDFQIADGVGISCNSTSALLKPILPLVQGEMEGAVMECYEDRRTEPIFVRQRIQEARHAAVKKLLGTTLERIKALA
jgi:hypothetical protein